MDNSFPSPNPLFFIPFVCPFLFIAAIIFMIAKGIRAGQTGRPYYRRQRGPYMPGYDPMSSGNDVDMIVTGAVIAEVVSMDTGPSYDPGPSFDQGQTFDPGPSMDPGPSTSFDSGSSGGFDGGSSGGGGDTGSW